MRWLIRLLLLVGGVALTRGSRLGILAITCGGGDCEGATSAFRRDHS